MQEPSRSGPVRFRGLALPWLWLFAAAACGPATSGPAQEPPAPAATAGSPPPRYVVDLRPPERFAAGHLPGSINLQWGYGQFELRAGRLFPPGSELRIVGSDRAEVDAAVAIAQKLGFAARGETPDFEAVPADRLARQQVLQARELHRRRAEFVVLDVRTAQEYARGHIRAALFCYPDDIRLIAPALHKSQPIAVICEGGWRSSMVASWLAREGFGHVVNVADGMAGWRAAKLPVETGAEQKGFR